MWYLWDTLLPLQHSTWSLPGIHALVCRLVEHHLFCLHLGLLLAYHRGWGCSLYTHCFSLAVLWVFACLSTHPAFQATRHSSSEYNSRGKHVSFPASLTVFNFRFRQHSKWWEPRIVKQVLNSCIAASRPNSLRLSSVTCKMGIGAGFCTGNTWWDHGSPRCLLCNHIVSAKWANVVMSSEFWQTDLTSGTFHISSWSMVLQRRTVTPSETWLIYKPNALKLDQCCHPLRCVTSCGTK